jgi:hypothetical protein
MVLLLVATASLADAPRRGIRGTPEAVAAARQLLEQAGGADSWRKRGFVVTESIYPASGNRAEVRVARDFERPARLLVATSASGTRSEWISPDGGWTRRNDTLTAMTPEALAAELQGLAQEPYAIYHRIAKDDPALRVELRDGSNLFVFEGDERLLCWFQRAPNGTLLGWGNFYDGAINQHYYGPLVEFGPARLPKFGTTASGSYRFEYLLAGFSDDALAEPPP